MASVEQSVLSTTNNILSTQKDFSNFTAYNNNLILYAAAVCIGFATKDMISDVMNEAILPFLVFWAENSLTRNLFIKVVEKVQHFPLIAMFLKKIGAIVWIVVVWIVVLWLTYFVFTKLIKIDIISGDIHFIQDLFKYIIHPQNINKIQQENIYKTNQTIAK